MDTQRISAILLIASFLAIGLSTVVNAPGLYQTQDIEERLQMIQECVGTYPNVRIDTISGLLVDYAREVGATASLRGLRALADFEYEFEMALMNAHMSPRFETVFLMSSERWFYVSASRIRELVRFGADVSEWVPPIVHERLREKL